MTDRKNMSMMELALQILSEQEKSMTFIEIYDLICAEKGINEEEKAAMISQVYADFIASAKFIYVGDDEWDIKGRRAIELWDKDGAYYDEYPDYEEELSLFEEDQADDEYSIDDDDDEDEDEDESIYEDDFDEDDIEDDEDSAYEAFEDDDDDYVEDEEDLVIEEDDELFEDEEEEEEEFDDEEYNEYMDDYEQMYED